MAFISSQAALEAEQEVHTYAIINGNYAQDFTDKVFYHKSFALYKGDETFNTVEDLTKAVKAGTIDMGIYLPSDAKQTLMMQSKANGKLCITTQKQLTSYLTV